MRQAKAPASSLRLTAAAGAAAVLALIAGTVARHQTAAFRTERRVRERCFEWKRLLRFGFRWAQFLRLTGLTQRVLRSQELRAQPPENVIHDRLRIGDM